MVIFVFGKVYTDGSSSAAAEAAVKTTKKGVSVCKSLTEKRNKDKTCTMNRLWSNNGKTLR